ncbi:DNA polymerase III subunit alpha [Streptomyces sp. CoH17]|uniref:DNA polymerase III subunit alpha n=1 Tax=Streptomyces sp. CoH17 TaxID=2992806 RepID=UPI00226E3BCC|nr:DNA polymerase III subunit alpha [Streptomyces sp. CoH17]
MGQFVPLHNHTDHGSFLDGAQRPVESVERAKKLGHKAMAITDHGECAGHWVFQKAAQEAGIHPILGMEGYLVDDVKRVRAEADRQNSHIVLLAENQTGLSNLWAVSSVAYANKYYKPIADWEIFREYSEGLIATSACMLAYLSRAIVKEDMDKCKELIGQYLSVFGEDNFFLEMHTWQILPYAFETKKIENEKEFNRYENAKDLLYGQITPEALCEKFEWYDAKGHPDVKKLKTRGYYTMAELVKSHKQSEERLKSILDTVVETTPYGHHVPNLPGRIKNTWLNEDMTKTNQGLVKLSEEIGVPLIVVNDSHYTDQTMADRHRLVWETSTYKSDQTDTKDFAADWVMSDEEVVYWMSQHGIDQSVTEEAIKNTARIAERCTAEVRPGRFYPTVTGSSEGDEKLFYDHIEHGFREKIWKNDELKPEVEKYEKRLLEEVPLIIKKGFHGYFNVVADYCKYAKSPDPDGKLGPLKGKEPWLVGPSRGSAGGSLTAWMLDIIEMDPVKYDLMFGRFIDPGRKGFPDIDLDFPQSKRPYMKDYARWRYGEDNVAVIGTLSKLQPRGALQDLCKAMGISFADSRAMASVIETMPDIDTANVDLTWDDFQEKLGEELKPWSDKYPELFKKIAEMVGLVRQSSTHAAGVIIANESLIGKIPLRKDRQGQWVTQFDMYEVEDLGFIKFDFLGIRHLDTLMQTDAMVHGEHDPQRFYNFSEKEYADPEVWQMVHKGKTNGVFQLETPGMTGVGKRFKPTDEVECADLISVNRPGLVRSGGLQEYLLRREGERDSSPKHPLLNDILGSTYGVFAYQEQIMKAVVELAGYTISESDYVRKILGKMLFSEMKKQRVKFVDGCLANPKFVQGAEEKYEDPKGLAELIFDDIETFGIYGFNRSHAIGYSMVSCWEAYMKCHHLSEHLVALMRTDPGRVNRYIREARRNKIPILPPSVNESERRFVLSKTGGIRYGLDTVKHVGASAVKAILQHREDGPFQSLDDFINRTPRRQLTSKVMENLISVGAFDEFGDRTQTLQEFYDRRKMKKTAPNFRNEKIMLQTEVELVGTYITKDPMHRYARLIEDNCLQEPEQMYALGTNEIARVGGSISDVREITTKTKRQMAFIKVSWNEKEFDITVFPDAWVFGKSLLKKDAPVICTIIRMNRGVQLSEFQRLDMLDD